MDEQNPENQAEPDLEHIWQFAGQGLRSSDFNTAMVHFYRGEVARSNTWRQRLDITTNWAVVTAGAALSLTFSTASSTPLVILIDTFLVLLFLFMEARRYRYYELWATRVRIMETNFFAALLSPPFMPHSDWADRITNSLNNPTFPISLMEALGRRYRRNYAPIFVILAASWIVKVWIHPTPVRDWAQFVARSAIGPIPGWLMLIIGLMFNGLLVALGLFTVSLRASKSEVFGDSSENIMIRIAKRLRSALWEILEVDIPVQMPRIRIERTKQLVYIISDEIEAISKALLKDVGRGVTLLQGTGMFTGKSHGVLMCVLEARQISQLRRAVLKSDPKAMVIVTPTQDVRGSGFRPLEA